MVVHAWLLTTEADQNRIVPHPNCFEIGMILSAESLSLQNVFSKLAVSGSGRRACPALHLFRFLRCTEPSAVAPDAPINMSDNGGFAKHFGFRQRRRSVRCCRDAMILRLALTLTSGATALGSVNASLS